MKKQVKPIFVIYFPIEIVKEKGTDEIKKFIEQVYNHLSIDYHVLAVESHTKMDIEFQGFYPKDFDEVKFEELKREISKHWSKI